MGKPAVKPSLFSAVLAPPAYITLILFVLILAMSFGGAPVFGDPDTAWHLAAGDLIRDLHSVPLYDSWSYTANGERWYNLSWLFDVALSWLFSLGGFGALYVLTIGVFAGAITAMAYYCIRRGASVVSVFLMIVPVLFVIDPGVLARPNLCSVILTLATYFLLHRYRRSGRLAHLLFLPFIMAVWTNLHGGFLLAFVIMGIFAFESLVNGERNRVRDYGLIVALCLAATLINPYGFGVYYGAYKTLATAFATYVMEWQPVEIGRHLPMTLLLLLVLIAGNAADKRVALVDRMLAIALFMLALSSERHTMIASLLLMPYLTLRLTALLYGSTFGPRVRSVDVLLMHDMEQKDVRIMGTCMALAALLFICVPTLRDGVLKEPAGFSKKSFPDSEAQYIATHYPTLHFLNDYNIGGYLAYLWRGKVKVFIDGRASSLYSEDLLRDYIYFMDKTGYGGRAQSVVTRYHIDGLVITNDNKNAGLWHWNSFWKPVYRGEVATVYIRKNMKVAR